MCSAKVFSFFSGAGLLDLGFESVGFEVVLVNENHRPFMEAYRYSRKLLGSMEPLLGHFDCDVVEFMPGCQHGSLLGTTLSELRATGNIVGFIGGPPCPDFSVGGKNRGQLGDNGKLSGMYVDLIGHYRPDFFLFENVKGLWKTRKHREYYEDMKRRLSTAGYALAERLINAVEYGVPQDRERIILLGFAQHIARSRQEFQWRSHIRYDAKTVFGMTWPTVDAFDISSSKTAPNGIAEELAVEYWFRKNMVEQHPNAEMCFVPRAGMARFLSVAEGDVSRKSYKRLHRWRYSPTACYGNNEVHLHPYLPRRISVAEALAIQSLPKEFVLPPDMSLSNAFKTVGNGVPFLAAKGVAGSIKDFLGVKD